MSKDGKKIASKAGGLLIGLGGIASGIALATGDASTEFVDNLLSAIGVENKYLSEGLTFLFGAGLIALVLSFRGAVSNGLLKGVFAFLAIVLGTYLVIRGIRFVIGFVKGTETGGA